MRRLDRWNDTPSRVAGEDSLATWLERQLGMPGPVGPTPTRAAKFRLPPSRLVQEAVSELEQYLRPDQIARDPDTRIRASFGGHFLDAVARRDGLAEHAPDAVVSPESTEQLSRIFQVAERFELRLRLRGAGTSADETQRGDEIDRPALAVDLTRFAKVDRWDRRAGFVEVSGGARYVDVESALAAHRFRLVDPSVNYPWPLSPYATVGAAFACGAEPRALAVDLCSPTGTSRFSADGSPAERATFLLEQSARGEAGVVTTIQLPIAAVEPEELRLRFLFAGWDDALAALRALAEANLPGTTAEACGPEMLARRLALAGRSLPTRLSGTSWLSDLLGGFWRRSPYRTPALVTVAFRGSATTLRDHAWRTRRLFAAGGALAVPESAIPPMLESVEPERLRSSLFAFRCLAETFDTQVRWTEASALVDRTARALHARFDRDGVRGWVGWVARASARGVALRASIVAPQLLGAEVSQYAAYRLAFERSAGERRALPLEDGPGFPVGRLQQWLAESADPAGRLRKVGVADGGTRKAGLAGGSRWRKLATEETRYWLEDAADPSADEATLWAPETPTPPPFGPTVRRPDA